jgi:hypothetical protein
LPSTLLCPSDTADTFRGASNNPKQPNGTSYAPGNIGGNGGNGGNGGSGGLF